MKLADFIARRLDTIVAEFATFARSLDPAIAELGNEELEDHAREILLDIVKDLATAESSDEKRDKSTGEATEASGAETAAGAHGRLRQSSGFSFPQLTAEYRALRASVLRLWMPTVKTATAQAMEEVERFHEAIDQALQESAIKYAQKTERARDTFLAILGHDLRSPLATMAMAGAFLTREGEGTEQTALIGARVKRGAASMTTMVNDLLEYARSELGGKIPVARRLADLGAICQESLEEAQTAHPDCPFELHVRGDTVGDFDPPRLAQLFSNLLNNAAQYRSSTDPVTLAIEALPEELRIAVTNFGRQIPSGSLNAIFDPMVQLSVSPDQKGPASTSLGLGLFIAREIALSHCGSISAKSSSENGTIFSVTLPRWVAA